METNEPASCNHRQYIKQLIREDPSQRSQQQLNQIGSHGNRIREPDSISRENWGLNQVCNQPVHFLAAISITAFQVNSTNR